MSGTEVNGSCPVSFNCSEEGLRSFDIGVYPSYVSIFSCTLSCLGSLLILLTFCLLKDLRTTTQKIITFLAMADLVSALGYIIGSVNFLTHFGETDTTKCKLFQDLCIAQSAITTWSSLVSFCWTVILAFHFFLIIVYQRFQLAGKLIPLYNVIAWGVPLLIVIPMLATGKLGYSPYATSNWCFVKDSNYNGLREHGLTVALILVGGKGWELVSYVSVSLLYILIFCNVNKIRRQLRNTQIESRVFQVEWRLLAIPILFILLRVWGTVQFIVSLTLPAKSETCISETWHNVFMALGLLQAFGDSGQGLGNAILYVLLSPTIRTRLCCLICKACRDVVEGRQGSMPQTGTPTSRTPQNHRVRQLNVNRKDDSSSSLLPHRPATGYVIRKYDSTSTTSSDQDVAYEHRVLSTTTTALN